MHLHKSISKINNIKLKIDIFTVIYCKLYCTVFTVIFTVDTFITLKLK